MGTCVGGGHSSGDVHLELGPQLPGVTNCREWHRTQLRGCQVLPVALHVLELSWWHSEFVSHVTVTQSFPMLEVVTAQVVPLSLSFSAVPSAATSFTWLKTSGFPCK